MPDTSFYKHDPYATMPKAPSFTVESKDLVDGGEVKKSMLSKMFGIEEGSDESPALSWGGFSADTQSFMVTCYDPDAPTPSGIWHWLMYDIPANITSLVADAGNPDKTKMPIGAKMLKNDAGFEGFVGAAPPPGPSHRYIFCVTALGAPTLQGITKDSSPSLTHFIASQHKVLGRGFLTVSYQVGDSNDEVWA